MPLIFQRRPGRSHLWLSASPHPVSFPEGAVLGLHLPKPAPSSSLVIATEGGEVLLVAPGPGWAILRLPGRVLSLRAEGAPLRLSGGLGEGPEHLACRLWSAEGLIPEAIWRRAQILGEGAVLALAGGPARPFLRLNAGEMGRITLPATPLPGPLMPVLAALRGPLPLAELAGLTLTLRAGAACEVLWEEVQLRPNNLANSAAPSRK